MDTAVNPVPVQVHLRLHDRALGWLTWAIAAGLFATVGWMAVQPADPLAAVSLLTCPRPTAGVVQIVLLAAIVSGVGTVMIGRRLPDAGVFAAALGMAVLSLRGDTTTYLLLSVADQPGSSLGSLAWSLAFEGLVWFVPIVAALIVATLVLRWFGADGSSPTAGVFRGMALTEIRPWSNGVPAEVRGKRTHLKGVCATGVCLGAAAVLFLLLATGSPNRSIQHGQACFAVAAAFYLATLLAYEVFPARTALWGCLAVPLLAVGAYAYAAVTAPSEAAGRVPSVPPSTFYRALPLQYVSVGTAAVIAAFWSVRRSAWLRHAQAKRAG